jgi:hypothetical protein
LPKTLQHDAIKRRMSLMVGLINEAKHETTENDKISRGRRRGPELNGIQNVRRFMFLSKLADDVWIPKRSLLAA